MRWGLNDLAQRLDCQPAAAELSEGLVPSPASGASGLRSDGRCMLRAIGELPEDELEFFELVRTEGMTQAEVAHVLGGDGVATAEPRPAAPGGATGRPLPG
jgi:DNA-directed RNA polymerase specialized sigma24 family protein